MGKANVGMIRELGEQINRLAGESTTKKAMEGSEEIKEKTGKRKIAAWVKGAIERLDKLVDEKTRIQIMENCGYNCANVNKRVIEKAKARRKKYKSLDEFLDAEQRYPMEGTRIVREGGILYQFYTPQSFTRPIMRFFLLVLGIGVIGWLLLDK